MLQFEGWKKTLVLFVILLGCAYAVPNLFNGSRGDQSSAGLMRFLPGEAINLGLDLQGGHIFCFVQIFLLSAKSVLRGLLNNCVCLLGMKKSASKG